LLAAIGVILILKQIPHLFGHDADVIGEMSFLQPDGENSFSELFKTIFAVHPGAALIGCLSIGLIVVWGRIDLLKRLPVPPPLAVVLFGVLINGVLQMMGSEWVVGPEHRVQLPIL